MIKKVSNEELIEKFMLHVPQSVMGTSFPPSVIKATQNEIETLRTQLAKANERISQYESKQDKGADLLIKLAKSNASMASLELELAKDNERVRELEVENSIIANSPDFTFDVVKDFFRQELNELAIENQIMALDKISYRLRFNLKDKLTPDAIDKFIASNIEQLRKEQE